MAADQDELSGPPPISLRDSHLAVDRASRPWTWRLGLFLRLLATAELLKGLFHWALLISGGGAAEAIAPGATGWFVATVFFAVADPVAAVGLWVGAAWGVAIWLIAAVGQIAAVALAPQTPAGWLVIAAVVLAMTAYVALTAKARGEQR